MKLEREIECGISRRDEFLTVVCQKEILGSEYRSLMLEIGHHQAGFLAQARPGQFIEIACGSSSVSGKPSVPFLRRPFSIA